MNSTQFTIKIPTGTGLRCTTVLLASLLASTATTNPTTLTGVETMMSLNFISIDQKGSSTVSKNSKVGRDVNLSSAQTLL
jgi:hypothetical protein